MAATGDELRAAMRRFPAAVAVVTVATDREPIGITVGSLVSVALEPPLVGMSIGRHALAHTPLREAGRFAASLLAGDQAALAQHFARSVPPIALWEGIALRDSPLAEPLLEGALAWLECRVAGEHPAGDHTLVVGEVLAVELGRPGPGLVYLEGGYRAV